MKPKVPNLLYKRSYFIIDALEKGLYIINAHVNGRIYSKKIIIK